MNDDVLKNFATKLQQLRKAAKMSKVELSLEADCSKSYIGKIESGQKTPGLKMIVKLSNALRVHVRDLFDFEYDYNQKE